LIPKKIIHIWGQGEAKLSLLSKAALVNMKLLNPDFEFLFFDNKSIEAFINDHFPRYSEIINSFRFPVQRYDFFRYLAIYQLGGFYFDLDVFLVSALHSLLKYDCVFSFEELTINRYLRQSCGLDWEIGNYAFGASPKHPFILALIENCVRALKDLNWVKPMMKGIPFIFQKDFYAFYTSGPGLVTRTLAERNDIADRITILFPEDACDINYWSCFGNIGIHLHKGTWVGRKAFIHNKLLRLWVLLVRKWALKESMKLGPKRSWSRTR